MQVIFTFYRNFLYPAIAVTLFSCYLLGYAGTAQNGMLLFWMKIFTDAALGLFFHLFQREQLYFFHNLGYSTVRLYTYTVLLDLSLWLMLTLLTARYT